MGMRVIKQDDGKFGLFSTISDRICVYDCTEEEMIEMWKERAATKAAAEMREWLDDVKNGWPRSPSMTLKEALKKHQYHSPDIVKQNPDYIGDVEFDDELREVQKGMKNG